MRRSTDRCLPDVVAGLGHGPSVLEALVGLQSSLLRFAGLVPFLPGRVLCAHGEVGCGLAVSILPAIAILHLGLPFDVTRIL